MSSEQFIKIRNLIEKEFSHAVTKHPKFCDHFIDKGGSISWKEAEGRIKIRNSRPPECAENVLMEEIAEAFNAYSQGNLEESLHEFAQCGAVVMRCMEFITNQLDQKLSQAVTPEILD